MSWTGLTTDNHLGAVVTHTEDLTIAEIREKYGDETAVKVGSNLEDMRAAQYQYDIMSHKMEMELAKAREKQYLNGREALPRVTKDGYTITSGQGIRAQMESANQVPYEPMTIDSMTSVIEKLIESIGKEERKEFVLRTGEGGMKEFDRATKHVTREDWTLEDWRKQLTQEMTL